MNTLEELRPVINDTFKTKIGFDSMRKHAAKNYDPENQKTLEEYWFDRDREVYQFLRICSACALGEPDVERVFK